MLKRGLTLLFKKRDFGLLMAVQFAAQAGDGIAQTALTKFIVFGGQKGLDPEAAPSPDVLLSMVLFLFVPYTVVSPFLGVVIDRWDRRRLLFVANGLRGAVVLILGLVGIGAAGNAALWFAFLLTLASTRVVLATKAAALPVTLDDSELEDGNAISQLGGAMFQIGGAGAAFIASSLLLPAGPIAAMRPLSITMSQGARPSASARTRTSGRWPWCTPAGHRARCAGNRSTRR